MMILVITILITTFSQAYGQCAITSATIRLDTRSTPQLADRDNLELTIEGITTGAKATSVTWRWNGNIVDRNTQIATGSFFDGGGEPIVDTGPCESQMYRVALLVRGRLPGRYMYTVNANTQDSRTSPEFLVEDPDPPTNIVLRQISNRRVQATWTPPMMFSGDTYHVYLNTVNINTGGTPVTGTTYTTGPLSTGFSVTLRIRGTTGTYLSRPAVSERFSVRDVLTPMITLSSVTATSVTLSLSQPTNSLPVDMYTATLTNACTGSKLTQSTNSTSLIITNLLAGTQYYGIVSATSAFYNLTSTGMITLATPSIAAPSGSPGVPTASLIMSTNITLTWTEIDCLDRNGVIISYTIQYREGTIRDRTINTQSSATTHVITGLKPFTQYTFTVAGINGNGTGPFSSASGIIRTAEDKPTIVQNVNLKTNFFSILLTWNEPELLNGMLNYYTIQYIVNGINFNNATMTRTFLISNLNPNTTVSNIAISATTGGGEGPLSPKINSTTLHTPKTVLDVMAVAISPNSVQVFWNNTGFTSETDFVIYYRQNETTVYSDMILSVPILNNSVVIENLDENSNYIFEVAVRASDNDKELIGMRSISNVVITPNGTVFTTTATSSVNAGTDVVNIAGGTDVVGIAGGAAAAVLALIALFVLILLLLFLHRKNHLCSNNIKSNSTSKYYHSNESSLQMKNINTNIAPNIEEFPSNTTAIEGEEVFFKVVVSGEPTPTLTWKIGEKVLFSNYSMTVGDDGTLIFPSTEMDQSGVYSLEARNSAGKAQREVKLEVQKECDNNVSTLATKQSMNIQSIAVNQFGDYVAQNHSSNNFAFREQFQGLYDGEGKSKTIGLSPQFKKLNRFANITVYDDNRIELTPLAGHENCQGTFINACYIDGYCKMKKFIASQGPLPKTVVNFWHLVWQERPPIIVMVTNLKEGNKNKCQQYWPDSGSVTYSPFTITITDSVILADFVTRTLQVKLEGSNRPFKLTQFHFTAWPDHGVPDYASPMLAFHRRVLTAHKGKKGPILVHCSAGVGRTGTFICIDSILEQIKKDNVINIAGIITKMRHQRMKMVQTVDQYVFLHDAILESVRCGDTQINAANLRVVLHKYGKLDPQTRTTTYQSQFDVLNQVSPKITEVVCTTAAKNPDKNRSTKYLPSDRFRVILKGVIEDYIHAVFAHGYKQQKAYIIAENPMAITVPNMLKVLHDRKIGAVVMLSALEENGQEVCTRYWPELNQVNKINEYEIDLISEEYLKGFTIRNISILHEKSQKAHQIMQFHITCWQPDGQCSSLRSVVDTIEEMSKVQRKTGNKPVFVHCSDTVTRSGMFCALATIIDRCKTEGVVDVFQVVKALRIQKPGAVPTVQNYRMIFEATLMFLDSFDTYANFQN